MWQAPWLGYDVPSTLGIAQTFRDRRTRQLRWQRRRELEACDGPAIDRRHAQGTLFDPGEGSRDVMQIGAVAKSEDLIADALTRVDELAQRRLQRSVRRRPRPRPPVDITVAAPSQHRPPLRDVAAVMLPKRCQPLRCASGLPNARRIDAEQHVAHPTRDREREPSAGAAPFRPPGQIGGLDEAPPTVPVDVGHLPGSSGEQEDARGPPVRRAGRRRRPIRSRHGRRAR